ncbi:hypothetical protein D7Z54_14510 [Salibacterium salarium]|uniref:Phage terminase, small subunit, putative, P27 family n=1 Tax=Salibacterium salarium TaxID=284579 RepID=A0A3R9P8H3_9BACI|nr:hypothetical protein [Salibacterium salarium]RSL32660.1 hypothetical protein D7Z54_14510 [Salibacterium salarium]
MAKLSAKKQDEIIEYEIEKLRTIFANVEEDKQKVAGRLIERVAFMTVTLQILEDNIKRKGPTYRMENGKQVMQVENPSQKSYNAMIQRYTAAYEKLFSLLPKGYTPGGDEEDDDGFDSFVNNR